MTQRRQNNGIIIKDCHDTKYITQRQVAVAARYVLIILNQLKQSFNDIPMN